VHNGAALAEFVKTEIEETRTLAVNYGHAKCGLSSEQSSQRFQLKTGLQINVIASELRGQFVFLPEVLSRTGEDGSTPGCTAQVRGQIEHTIEIGVKGSILTLSRRAFERLLHNIFGDYCFAAMRAILSRIGLKVNTQGGCPFGFVRLKIC
jgi:hypothetical protein